LKVKYYHLFISFILYFSAVMAEIMAGSKWFMP